VAGDLGHRAAEVEVDVLGAVLLQWSKYVYDFTEGNKDQKDLLGGKGANLAEMTNLGMTPFLPGFTVTT
jgi:hypothetical protein